MPAAGRDFEVRVFTDSCQGGRKYMEDAFCVAFQSEPDSDDVGRKHDPSGQDGQSENQPLTANRPSIPRRRKYVYAGIFDGHGGKEAAIFTRDHLLQNILSHKDFWSNDDDAILRAIREGFMSTHLAMLKELAKWPKTSSGLPSTSGTTASVCFIMNNKVYSGHVGDSRIILARKNPSTDMWIPHSITEDHKPGSDVEKARITKAGGEVMTKSGVDRVVWFRPKYGHRGPIRRSTSFDKIPFLAIARSLGDLWSYNPDSDTYVVSPDPDLQVTPLNPDEHKCLILASDGLWNMLLDYESVRLVQELREDIKPDLLKSLRHPKVRDSQNPSEVLVHYALQKWNSSHLRADNTSAVTLILSPTDSVPPSPPCHVTEENISSMPQPTVLPFSAEPAEFIISAVDPMIERVAAVKPADSFALLSPSMQSLCKFTESHADAWDTSPPRKFNFESREDVLKAARRPAANVLRKDADHWDAQFSSLLKSGAHRVTKDLDGDDDWTKDSYFDSKNWLKAKAPDVPLLNGCQKEQTVPVVSDSKEVYINELPDESFEALSHSLKLSRSPALPKVISGVTVISDFDEDSSRSDSSFNGKKNKSCSVTEALVENGTSKESSFPDKVANSKTLQELHVNSQSTVSEKDEIENNSSDKINAPQPSSSTESLSKCSPRGKKRKAGKWLPDSPSKKKFLRSSRVNESRALRITRNVMAHGSRMVQKISRPLRLRKISLYNSKH